MNVSLVIPMYNEEQCIENTLNEVIKYFKHQKYDYEIIVVDDGSKDRSVQKVQPFLNKRVKLIRARRNKGKGLAVKRGMLCAKNDFVAFMDADLPYSLEGISNLYKNLSRADIAIGTRALPESVVEAHPIWYRQWLSVCFYYFREFIVTTGVKDTQCGAKAFRKDVAYKIFIKQKLTGWGFDAEVLYLARKYKNKVVEVPLHLLQRHSFEDSRLNPVIDPIKIFVDLFRIKLYNLFGRY